MTRPNSKLAAMPPLGLCVAALLLMLVTAGSCNPLYSAAPATVDVAIGLERADWAKALTEVDTGAGSFAASVRRGEWLGVCR